MATHQWTTKPKKREKTIDPKTELECIILNIRVMFERMEVLQDMASYDALQLSKETSGPIEERVDWLCNKLLAIQNCSGTSGITKQENKDVIVSVTLKDNVPNSFNLDLFEKYLSPLFKNFLLKDIEMHKYEWFAVLL